MPFEIEQFGGFRSIRGARIRLLGRFCISDGLQICQLCHPSKGRHQLFYFDFSEIIELTDDAIAWFSLFLRWAESDGVSVRLENMTAVHRELLAKVGISESGTALCNARSERFRHLFDWAGDTCVMELVKKSEENNSDRDHVTHIRSVIAELMNQD